MKKYFWILILALVPVLALSGCSMPVGGGHGNQVSAKIEPLNKEAWPTAPLATPRVSPTPFPKVTLEPTATRNAKPEATPVAATPTVEGIDYGGDIEALKEQATALSGGLEPVASFMVTGDGSTLRQGPGDTYGSIVQVEPGELGAVLGTNGGDWLYAMTITGSQGWLSQGEVRVMGTLDGAPVLPPNPLASASAESATTVSAVSAPSASTLETVAAATVSAELLNLRQGPGAAYGQQGTLSTGDQVSVLALNKAGDWALITTADGLMGWVSAELLAIEGSLADIPAVVSARPGSDIPEGQIAPIAGFSQNTGSAATSSVPAKQPEAEVVPVATLTEIGTPVATARTKDGQTRLYSQSGTDSAPIATLGQDVAVSILALNPEGDWALVDPDDIFQGPGWIKLAEINVDGDLDAAPRVVTGWIESHGVKVRIGPAIYDQEIGSLARNDLVAILGQDDDGSWFLVRPVTGGGPGWVASSFVQFDTDQNTLPSLPASVLKEQTQGQVEAEELTAPPVAAEPLNKLAIQLSTGGDIVLVNPDGSDLNYLTHGIDPALSPDGQQLAFTRWVGDGEDSGLWVANTDGSGERLLLGEMRKAKGPDWSPDGSQIVLNFQDGGRLDVAEECVNLVEVATGEDNPPNLPTNAYGIAAKTGNDGMPYLCWNIPPDAFWSLRVVDTSGGDYKDINGGRYGFRPAWDPAQPWRIVADSGFGLVEADLNSDTSRGLTNGMGDGSPTISPDGRYVAFVANENNGYDIHRINADGSGELRLTQTPLWVTAAPGDNQAWRNVAPEWSPDGSQIAFLTERNGRWEIWVMNADGSDQHPMFSDEVNDQLDIQYDLNDERVISWR